jgi:hypothetical protein
LLDRIYEAENTEDLIEVMNAGNDRLFSWNFRNLVPEGCGTVEFRRPPGVKGAASCVRWINFATVFIRAAMGIGGSLELAQCYQARDVNDLKRLLTTALPDRVSIGVTDLTRYTYQYLLRQWYLGVCLSKLRVVPAGKGMSSKGSVM